MAKADLFDLTFDLFWARIYFGYGVQQISWRGPVLDYADSLCVAARTLLKEKKYHYSASEGVVEVDFVRKGNSVLIDFEGFGCSLRIPFGDFVSDSSRILVEVIDVLVGKYPELMNNQALMREKKKARALLDAYAQYRE